jgi:hypothetical protein
LEDGYTPLEEPIWYLALGEKVKYEKKYGIVGALDTLLEMICKIFEKSDYIAPDSAANRSSGHFKSRFSCRDSIADRFKQGVYIGRNHSEIEEGQT